MNKSILAIIVTLLLFVGCQSRAQNLERSVPDQFNMDFENIENGAPVNWTPRGTEGYQFSIDSTTVKNGKYAAAIELKDGTHYGVWGLSIHGNYEGKRITLSGYVKTENVIGYASLLLRIDPEIGVEQVKINGTNDWKQYEVTVKMNPRKTTYFAVGAMLIGTGKVWFDDLRLFIDGKDINELTPILQDSLSTGAGCEFDQGSNISIDQLTDSQIENLTVLGKIWGFLKYYHPNVATGANNWDYELFKILPKMLDCVDNVQRDAILIQWIEGLGHFSESKKISVPNTEIKLLPDLAWLDEPELSNSLASLLTKVKKADRTGSNHYVECQLFGNPDFKNENSYPNKTFPDTGFRLLALYRYWNIIQYYFPYKYLIDEDWKNILKAFIPKIVDAKNRKEYTLAILELVGRIQDSHANISANNPILVEYFGKYYAPIALSFIEDQPVVTGLLDDKSGKTSGMEIGDIITKINDVPIADKINNLQKYTPASNLPAQLRDIARNLLRSNDFTINIEFIRNNKNLRKAIETLPDSALNIYRNILNKDTCFKMINKEIAYLDNGSLKAEYLPQFWPIIKKTKGLIIDNRNYPLDHPLYELCGYLMPESTPFFKYTHASITTPGLFSFGEKISAGNNNADYYKGKVIILVNENTQSSAETHTMAYRLHPNALVIGSATTGANGNLSFFYLPGGIYTTISGIGIYYPDGKETQRIGLVPDIEVKPTIQGIKEGRDEVLEKAVKIIEKE
jgi:hypothetical protein